MMNWYMVGILFTLGYQFGGIKYHKDTWGNALLTVVLAFTFPFYWGLTLALFIEANKDLFTYKGRGI